MIRILVTKAFEKSGLPQQVAEALPSEKMLREFDGVLDKNQIMDELNAEDKGGPISKRQRFFWEYPFQFKNKKKTYILSNQWTSDDAVETAKKLAEKFPDLNIEFKKTETPDA